MKHCSLLFYVLIVMLSSSVQLHAQNKISLGLTTGKTFSGATFGNRESTINGIEIKTSTDNLFGIHVQINLTDRIALRTGVSLVQKGIYIRDYTLPERYEIHERYNNAALPLAFTMRMNLTKNVFVREIAGAEFEIIDGQDGYQFADGWVNQYDFVLYDKLQRHFSGNLFTGCDIEWQNKSGATINLGLSYHQGVSFIRKGELQYTVDDHSFSNSILINGNYVALTLGCYLPGGSLVKLFKNK